MIIDIHTHYGMIPGSYHMPIEMQLDAMKRYHIDYALISSIESAIDNEGIEGNIKMLDLVRAHKDKLGCMLWGRENLDDSQKKAFEELYLINQELVKGIKLHPDMSHKRADDACFDFFYELGKKYQMPVLLHTKDSLYSKVAYVVNVAKRFPDTILILGHMGIGSDGDEALEAVKAYPNLYGDTAWVKLDVVKKAESMGISHKLMFSTDSPISGKDCYGDAYYTDYYILKDDYMKGVMSHNAKKLFRI